jgi:16S rRNA (adenine1518-N6/adenine1519-N6)-dimethyltransferase
MSKLEQLKSLLQSHNLWARKGLGQNFLVDEKAFDKIIAAADLKPSDNVIEVGPGTGFLTERLVDKVKHVTAVELDKGMIEILEDRFNGVKNLELVNEDILKFRIQDSGFRIHSYKVVANIPYYITSPLIKHFLQSDNRPELMVVLVQKEVAEKIIGKTGKSVITIETQLFGRPEIVDIVSAGSFCPAPKVDSAILKINVYKKPLVPEDQIEDFLRLVKFGFSQKRKKLSNTLSAGLHIKPAEMSGILEKSGINPDLRAENLEIRDWEMLAKVLTENNK